MTARLWRYPIGILLLVGAVAAAAGGCDGGASKRASQYRALNGTWDIDRVHYGSTDSVVRDTIRIEFGRDDEGRYYRLFRPDRAQSTVREGAVEMHDRNVLSMSGGFTRPLVWTFDFESPNELSTSVRFSLQSTWEGSSEEFLDAIGRSGGARRLEIDLVRLAE